MICILLGTSKRNIPTRRLKHTNLVWSTANWDLWEISDIYIIHIPIILFVFPITLCIITDWHLLAALLMVSSVFRHSEPLFLCNITIIVLLSFNSAHPISFSTTQRISKYMVKHSNIHRNIQHFFNFFLAFSKSRVIIIRDYSYY